VKRGVEGRSDLGFYLVCRLDVWNCTRLYHQGLS